MGTIKIRKARWTPAAGRRSQTDQGNHCRRVSVVAILMRIRARTAVQAAKAENMPADNIKRALQKGMA
jgi:hypothetical protein